MIDSGFSPLIDAQGDYDPDKDVISLSDIETADSLSKFSDINATDCQSAVLWSFSKKL